MSRLKKAPRKKMKENQSKLNIQSTTSNQCESNDVVENKNSSSKDIETVHERKKITNLDDDCLDVIFRHLDLNELINVADSSKQFQNSVCRVYRSNYRNVRMLFYKVNFKYCRCCQYSNKKIHYKM